MLLDPALFAAYLVTATLLVMSPGPDTMLVLASSAAGGRRAGVAATFGVSSGGLVHASAATLGLSALIAASPEAFDLIRIAGAIYLLVIGVQALRRAVRGEIHASALQTVARGSLGADYRRGLVTNVLNPKVVIFYVALLPQFANPALGHMPLQILMLALTHTLIGTLWLASLAAAAGWAAERVAGNARVRTWLDAGAGAIYLLLALRIVLLDRRVA